MLFLCQSLQIRVRYLILQSPRGRANDERPHVFLYCNLVYRTFDRIALPHCLQSLAAGRIVGQAGILPERQDAGQQFLLPGVPMDYVIGFDAVGKGGPGYIVDIQVAY